MLECVENLKTTILTMAIQCKMFNAINDMTKRGLVEQLSLYSKSSGMHSLVWLVFSRKPIRLGIQKKTTPLTINSVISGLYSKKREECLRRDVLIQSPTKKVRLQCMYLMAVTQWDVDNFKKVFVLSTSIFYFLWLTVLTPAGINGQGAIKVKYWQTYQIL